MKKCTIVLFMAAFTAVFAQEKKYEIAVVGFYNLENLFDTESSMQTINVDKLKAGEVDYVKAEDYSSDVYYGAAWNSLYENVSISKSKTNYFDLPNVPIKALRFYKPKKLDYEYRNETSISKREFKEIVAKDPKWLSKKEFREFIKDKESVDIGTNIVVARVNDYENTPTGQRQYTQELYEDKLNKLASVINQLGADYSKDGVVLMGLAEIENSKVLGDLIATSELKKKGYKILQYDCMYSRGVDVALLYQEKYFDVVKSHTLQIEIYNDKNKTDQYYTRDILWVEGKLLGETVHVFVNHWPSRSGGEAKSSKNRELGAAACKKVIDELMAKDPNTQIILMGDFNDDPNNNSLKEVVGAAKDVAEVKKGGMFNPLFKDYKKGYGSLAYRGSWNLFDQILISSSFVDTKSATWKIQDAEVVYNQDWITRFGGYEGGPNRSFGGNNYQGGYSDHLPSVVYLKRLALEDKDNDGIADKDDACPDVAGLEAFKGCPDTDGDGIEDSKDDCPEVKGELANKGCPWLDSDGDGVLDKDDKCPQTKGLASNAGCPEVKTEVKKAIQAVFENLVFDTGKSTIKNSSDDELITLAKILMENPELLLSISGHTDNMGDDSMNMDLSKDRAYAVKDRLTSLDVEATRMEVFYFGETQPVASNDTPEGQQANRRVVFEVHAK
mgnify:CR=1 FL=1|jgi:outer membrane protein OmpA-like peptidoglycan-associated protein